MPQTSLGGVAGSPAASAPDDLGRLSATLLAGLPGMAYRWRNDSKSSPLFMSAGCHDLTGFAPEEFLTPGRVVYLDLIHPSDRDAVKTDRLAALAGRRAYELRYRIRTADGGEKWVADRGRGLLSDDDVEALEGFVTDITAQRLAETVLREHNANLALAFSNARDMMLLARVEPGPVFRVESVNRRYLDIVRAAGFVFTSEELAGRTFSELQVIFHFPDDVWQGIMHRYRQVVETRQPLHYDEVTQTPHGVFHGQSSIAPILDEAGVCRFVLYCSTDVTSNRRAAIALRESEEKFAKAFRAVPDAVFITELASGRVVDVNEGCTRIYGFTHDECVGRRTTDLGIWHDMHDRDRLLAKVQSSGGRVRDLEIHGRTRSGAHVIALVSCETIELDGRPHLVTIAHDVTERRRAETGRAALEAQLRQAQKLDALGQLAGGIAHDFNNILTGIIAHTELAVMDLGSPAEVRSHLGSVRKACDRAADLVRQILTFSRQQTQERKPAQLRTVIHEAMRLLRSSLPKSIEIVERLEANAPTVLADTTQMHQVVMNLCTNAAHAMRGRPGRLTVVLEEFFADGSPLADGKELEPGRYARLAIDDTGHGMDESTLARMFEPFFTTKGPGEGTGLGLAVVHGIVEEHEGLIAVRSRLGEGTRFEIYLPEHIAVVTTDSRAGMELPRGNGERILLVDDELSIVSGIAEMLRRSGYQVTPQNDPRLAAAMFETAPSSFDAVVTDLTMPHISGLELARRFLARRPELPVLLATGHSGVWTLDGVRALGVRDLLTKPLTAAKLLRSLREALAKNDAASTHPDD